MHQRRLATFSVFVALVVVALTSAALAGQTATPSKSKTQQAYTPPRGADGHLAGGIGDHPVDQASEPQPSIKPEGIFVERL